MMVDHPRDKERPENEKEGYARMRERIGKKDYLISLNSSSYLARVLQDSGQEQNFTEEMKKIKSRYLCFIKIFGAILIGFFILFLIGTILMIWYQLPL